MHEYKVLCASLAAAVLAVAIIALAVSFSTWAFVAGGYCQTVQPGTSSFAWVRCGPPQEITLQFQ